METIAIELMQDFSEIVHYEHTGIPLYIRTADLSVYPSMCAPCHWHDDIEWIYIISGKMCYYINGRRILLNENDFLMVNSRQMHYGCSYKEQDCQFLCILFHPSLFGSNKCLLQKYVTPVIENADCEYLHFHSKQARGKEIAEYLEQIRCLKAGAANAYEMQAIAIIFQLWSSLLQCKELAIPNSKSDCNSDLEIQKNMVSFIYQYYMERISLNEIAASGNVSRSKCCLIFKHYLQQSPVDFLNTFRLKTSCSLLRNTEKSITEIAFSCGFNHLSYFSKLFIRTFGCTPREYRNRESKNLCGKNNRRGSLS